MAATRIRTYGKACDHPAVSGEPAVEVHAVNHSYPGLEHPHTAQNPTKVEPS